MILFFFGPEHTASHSSQKIPEILIHLTTVHVPLCDGPSQMPPSPEKSTALLDTVNIGLLWHSTVLTGICGCNYVCGTWQRFAKVVLSPCGDIAYRWMTILDAVPPEGSEITVVLLRLAPLSFTHWNSSRFLESFNYVMHCWRWNIQISSYLSLRNIVFKHSIIFSRICWQTGDPRPIFAPKGLDLSWMLLLYQIIITINLFDSTVSKHIILNHLPHY